MGRRGRRGRKPYGYDGRALLALARYAGEGVGGAYRLALRHPRTFLQLWHDMRLLAEREEDEGRPAWLERGERAVDARDRLRREREEAKRKLGV